MRRTVVAETHRFRLARRDAVSLDGADGMELRVHHGCVWLTQDGDTRDIVIGPGQAFRLDRDGRAVIEVLRDAEISLRTLARPAKPRRLNAVIRGVNTTLELLQGALHAARAHAARNPATL